MSPRFECFGKTSSGRVVEVTLRKAPSIEDIKPRSILWILDDAIDLDVDIMKTNDKSLHYM